MNVDCCLPAPCRPQLTIPGARRLRRLRSHFGSSPVTVLARTWLTRRGRAPVFLPNSNSTASPSGRVGTLPCRADQVMVQHREVVHRAGDMAGSRGGIGCDARQQQPQDPASSWAEASTSSQPRWERRDWNCAGKIACGTAGQGTPDVALLLAAAVQRPLGQRRQGPMGTARIPVDSVLSPRWETERETTPGPSWPVGGARAPAAKQSTQDLIELAECGVAVCFPAGFNLAEAKRSLMFHRARR